MSPIVKMIIALLTAVLEINSLDVPLNTEYCYKIYFEAVGNGDYAIKKTVLEYVEETPKPK